MITPSIGTKTLHSQLEYLLDSNTPVFIHGSPGIGKSYIINDIANKRNWDIKDVRLSQLDPVDLRGVPSIQNGHTVWMSPIFFPTDEASQGILFLDELNSAPLSVQAAVYQLVLDRKIGEYTLPKGWRIVCAGNKINDKGVVFRLPSPLSNRMVHLVLEAKYEDFKEWAFKNGIEPSIIGFLGFRPDLLSQEVPKDSETNPAFATPRSWTMLSNIIKNVPSSKIEPIIFGTVGYGAGVEYMAFLKHFHNLPNVDDILEGKSEFVSDEASILYALTSALIQKFDGSMTQSTHLINYSKKLPVEFCVMLIKDALTKHESISQANEFESWVEEYGIYII